MAQKRTKTARKGTKQATDATVKAWLLSSGSLRQRILNYSKIGREMEADGLGPWNGRKVKRVIDKLWPLYLNG